MDPVLATIEKEYGGRVQVQKIDVDDDPVSAQQFNVRSMPTFVLVVNGREVGRTVGSRPVRCAITASASSPPTASSGGRANKAGERNDVVGDMRPELYATARPASDPSSIASSSERGERRSPTSTAP